MRKSIDQLLHLLTREKPPQAKRGLVDKAKVPREGHFGDELSGHLVTFVGLHATLNKTLFSCVLILPRPKHHLLQFGALLVCMLGLRTVFYLIHLYLQFSIFDYLQVWRRLLQLRQPLPELRQMFKCCYFTTVNLYMSRENFFVRLLHPDPLAISMDKPQTTAWTSGPASSRKSSPSESIRS